MNAHSILLNISALIIPLIFAITLHEVAHGWVANKLGDKTALMMGRITLNPLKHIDLFGTIILPILILVLSKFNFTFGWAKPVPVTWSNLRNPRRDMALVALAGPAANLLMALMWAGIAKALFLSYHSFTNATVLNVIAFFLMASFRGILINIVLMVLNLIPLPPLDGSRVVSAILPPRLEYAYSKLEPYGMWILIALLALGVLGRILWPIVSWLASWIIALFGLGQITL